MEALFSLLVGALFAVSIYLFLSKHIIRMLLGAAILGNAVNLLIFTAGRLTREVPPIIATDETTLTTAAANPLPQALILTAIVISFSFFAFLLVLGYRAFQELDTDDTDEMRVAEPADEDAPPLGY
ncbi:Na+/H+ antiporter subunit C [Pseudohoeflea coraliihabitans]|uniref:Na+/H+ antiporter subunit C n=1 Tax=Pseudohoeflea coraliihabitans TaxID=2860393 RepID=A0ABS6WRN1_9HYPH|nr:Na+/H+ antiporter subunit C [Pseudohoeflea sp. DP4N28-3]MBW3098634.1 Na+/H+ antiporter subunit C [Pseudohoeflea sp. DP4N28-3]